MLLERLFVVENASERPAGSNSCAWKIPVGDVATAANATASAAVAENT